MHTDVGYDFPARISMVIEQSTVEGISRKPRKYLVIRYVAYVWNLRVSSVYYDAFRCLKHAEALVFMETSNVTLDSTSELKLWYPLRRKGEPMVLMER